MKITKKVSSCILAFLLILCTMSFSVFAVDPEESRSGIDSTITIYPSSDGSVSVENKTFNLYRIFDVSVSIGTNGNKNVSYTWNIPTGETQSPFYDFFFTDWSGKGTVLVDPTGVTAASSVRKVVDYISSHNSANEMAELADNLYDYSVTKNITPDVTTPSTSSSSKIEYTGLQYGYYLIAETTANLGTGGVRSAPVLTTAAPDAVIYLKATKPSIDKNIVGKNATGNYFDTTRDSRVADGYFPPVKGISASAGDEITFAVTFKVPKRSDYRLGYAFKLKDVFPDSFSLVDNSIYVYESGKELAGVHDRDASVNKDNTPDANYWISDDGTMEFNFDKVGTDSNLVYPVGNPITILYKVQLNDKVHNENVNTVTLTYSSDPTDATKTSSVTSSAKVYSYQFVLGKYAANTDGSITGIFLTGASFELYDENENIISFKKSTENGAYIVADPSDTSSTLVTTLDILNTSNEGVSDDANNIDGGKAGQLKILGLGSGEYSLREIKAPDGYSIPQNDFKFSITDEFGSVEGIPTNLTVSFTNPDDNKVKLVCSAANAGTQKIYVRVPNLPGSTLPSTGGMGTFLFIGIGVVLMGTCALYFVIRKKVKSNPAK